MTNLIYLVILTAATLLTGGCRSVRESSQSSLQIEVRETESSLSASDTLTVEAASEEISQASAEISRTEAGSVDIVRDSVGNPVKIEWTRSGQVNLSALSATATATAGLATRFSAEKKNDVSTDLDLEETETKTADPDMAKKLEFIIGMSLLSLVGLFYLFDWIWRKIKARQEA